MFLASPSSRLKPTTLKWHVSGWPLPKPTVEIYVKYKRESGSKKRRRNYILYIYCLFKPTVEIYVKYKIRKYKREIKERAEAEKNV